MKASPGRCRCRCGVVVVGMPIQASQSLYSYTTTSSPPVLEFSTREFVRVVVGRVLDKSQSLYYDLQKTESD